MYCPICGGQIIDNLQFCPRCGARIGSASSSYAEIESEEFRKIKGSENQKETIICSCCGTPAEPGQSFCSVCGALLKESLSINSGYTTPHFGNYGFDKSPQQYNRAPFIKPETDTDHENKNQLFLKLTVASIILEAIIIVLLLILLFRK